MRLPRFAPAILAALSLHFAAHAAGPAPFLRRPDVHGDSVVFTAEGDLWLASITSGGARRITSHPGLETDARFSPNGQMLAFEGQYDGGHDVYVMPVGGGAPKRLTWDPRLPRVVGWTPDGQNVLFLSRRDNAERRLRLWSVPATGGMPTLLPIPKAELAAMAPDGKRVAYVPVSAEWQHWKRYQGGQADDIWLTDVTTKTFRKLTTDPAIDTTPTWAGNAIYFISEREGLSNLYKLDPDNGAVTAATTYTDDSVHYPSSDGQKVIFEHGNGLALYDPANGQTKELAFSLDSDRIHTREQRVPVADFGWVSIGPAGKRVLIESRGQLASVPAEEGDWRVLATKPGARNAFPAWSHDGAQIAFVSDRSGEEAIWTAPATGPGEPKQLSKNADHKGPMGMLLWSPDGKNIAGSDRECRIFLVDAKSGAMTLVDQADRGGAYDYTNYSYRFSPDGKWLAYNRLEPNWNDAVYLYEIATGKKTRLTSPEMESAAPAFSPDGKFLFFLQNRDFNPTGGGASHFFSYDKTTRVTMLALAKDTKSPFLVTNEEEGAADKSDEKADEKAAPKPAAKKGKAKDKDALPKVKVDIEGIADRVADVPVPADHYIHVEPVEGRLLMLVNTSVTPGDDTPNEIRALDLKNVKKPDVTTIASDVSDYEVSADSQKLLIESGHSLRVADASTGPVSGGDKGHVDMGGVQLVVNPVAEWDQIFNESWRIARDFFYDPNMHGIDWPPVKTKYAAQMKNVGDRNDLNEVLGDMIAELNIGHAYVGGGDLPGGAKTIPNAYLAADVEPVAPDAKVKNSVAAYRITHILAGDGFDMENRSPLLTPGVNVKEGDYILAVAGTPVKTDQDIQALLVGLPGQVISLTVNDKPTLKGSREVRVKPLASDSKARYYDWVNSRREYVRANGGDNLGYVHVPDMEAGGLQEFTKHYYPNVNKDGIVYDVRYNGGGYIDAMLLLQISNKPYTWFKPRYGASWTRQDWGPVGYGVAVSNENNYSDAEEFLDAFQRLGVGPVVGARTGGAEVGSGNGYPLIDGGKLYIPNYGEWSPDGQWVIEGHGVTPDMLVEQDPAAQLQGKDPQLDRAIAYLKDQIAKKPVVRPTPPPFPNKAYKPRVAQG